MSGPAWHDTSSPALAEHTLRAGPIRLIVCRSRLETDATWLVVAWWGWGALLLDHASTGETELARAQVVAVAKLRAVLQGVLGQLPGGLATDATAKEAIRRQEREAIAWWLRTQAKDLEARAAAQPTNEGCVHLLAQRDRALSFACDIERGKHHEEGR